MSDFLVSSGDFFQRFVRTDGVIIFHVKDTVHLQNLFHMNEFILLNEYSTLAHGGWNDLNFISW